MKKIHYSEHETAVLLEMYLQDPPKTRDEWRTFASCYNNTRPGKEGRTASSVRSRIFRILNSKKKKKTTTKRSARSNMSQELSSIRTILNGNLTSTMAAIRRLDALCAEIDTL